MSHIDKYKRQNNRGDVLGPNKYIYNLSDADYRRIGPAGIKSLYRSLLLVEHRRYNGPLHIAEENEYFQRIEKTLFYARMGYHIAFRNLLVTFKGGLFGGKFVQWLRK